MNKVILRKYGEEAIFDFSLFETDGIDLKVDAVHASGDTVIMKDEGAEEPTDNDFIDEGQGYSLVLTATEMEAARIVIYIVDQGTKAWLDPTPITIETYGHANAQHPDMGNGSEARLAELDAANMPAVLDLTAIEANVELHVSNSINNTIPLYNRADGTLTADGTEQVLYEITPTVTIVPDSITMSVGAMVDGDKITIRMYAKLKSGGSYELIDSQVYIGENTPSARVITGQPNRYGWKVTLEQSAGTYRDYDWERYTLTT